MTAQAEATPMVDIGVPAYRRATFVAEAIESVLAQTYDRWRLTVCDNGEGFGAIYDAIAHYLHDERISYDASGVVLGVADNWTRAIAGDAPYVGLLNDDDLWHPRFLERRVAALERHPECGFAFSSYNQVDSDGCLISEAAMRFEGGVLGRDTLAEWLTRQNIIVPPAILVRRSAYEAVGPTFAAAWHYCDWEMWSRLAAGFPAYFLEVRDNDYRRHGQTNTLLHREDPERLLAMLDHIEGIFASEIPSHRVSRLARAHDRSTVLLNAAADSHQAGGWQAAGALYSRAIQTYPPSFLSTRSLALVIPSIVGTRGARALARVRREIIGRRSVQ